MSRKKCKADAKMQAAKAFGQEKEMFQSPLVKEKNASFQITFVFFDLFLCLTSFLDAFAESFHILPFGMYPVIQLFSFSFLLSLLQVGFSVPVCS